MPSGLTLERYDGALGPDPGPALVTVDQEGAHYVTWMVEKSPGQAARYEFKLETTVAPIQEDRTLESRALASWQPEEGVTTQDEEWVMLRVEAQARILRYLPALYRKDELMGRFLMLFESFWTPIEGQIDALPLYFDPRFAPPEFLPWLASWLSLVLDEQWPLDQRRKLLRAAASLYRRRGTRRGLQEYLEIYTGQPARIIEHRAYNLRLGSAARLGPAIALGKGNVPHTFVVLLRLPPAVSGDDPVERVRKESERRRKIEAIIEAEKPAHTAYELRLEIITEEQDRELRN